MSNWQPSYGSTGTTIGDSSNPLGTSPRLKPRNATISNFPSYLGPRNSQPGASGNPGAVHLAVSLGIKAIEAGYRVLFTSAANLIAALTKAHGEGRLEEKLKVYTTPRLLVIDEIGYLAIDRQGANLFFQLISRRYERGPMILTSNQSFSAWGDVFGDRVIATAILDRLLHHAVTLNIRGNSYRLKEKLKAGLVRSLDDSSSQPGGEI